MKKFSHKVGKGQPILSGCERFGFKCIRLSWRQECSGDGATTENRFFTTGPDGNIIEKVIVNLNGRTIDLTAASQRHELTYKRSELPAVPQFKHNQTEATPAPGTRKNNSNDRNRFWKTVDTINDIGNTFGPKTPQDFASFVMPHTKLLKAGNVAVKTYKYFFSRFFKAEEATSKAIPTKALQNGGRQINTVNAGEKSIANTLHEALKNAKPTMGKPNQIEAVLDDGTKVIFRRDIGEHAHEIKRGTGVKVDHYNIEIQVPGAKTGRYNSIENLHIVVDNNLNFVEAFTSKNGVLKDVPKLFNQSKP